MSPLLKTSSYRCASLPMEVIHKMIKLLAQSTQNYSWTSVLESPIPRQWLKPQHWQQTRGCEAQHTYPGRTVLCHGVCCLGKPERREKTEAASQWCNELRLLSPTFELKWLDPAICQSYFKQYDVVKVYGMRIKWLRKIIISKLLEVPPLLSLLLQSPRFRMLLGNGAFSEEISATEVFSRQV